MNQPITGSKPRYEILYGLRGVAAVIVVMFHLFETYSKGVPYQIAYVVGSLTSRCARVATRLHGLLLLRHCNWLGIRLDEALRPSGPPMALQ